jgi:MEMO1 family protein
MDMAGVIWGGLVPHPPLIIPGIGDDETQQVHDTIVSMKKIAKTIQDLQPDHLVIISPHGPVFHDGVPIWDLSEMRGSFAQFGYPHIRYEVSIDRNMAAAIRAEAKTAKVPLISLDDEMVERTGIQKTLDHGVMVPLHYLQEAGIDVPVVLLSIGWVSKDELFRLGKAIQRAAVANGSRTVVLASGDLSHCLQENAPAGHHPAGRQFDLFLKEYFAKGQLDKVFQMDNRLVDQAAECGYRPIVILLGALSGLTVHPQVHSYESPFGVGYMVVSFAVAGFNHTEERLHPEDSTDLRDEREPSTFVRWAKVSLETYIIEEKRKPLPEPVPEVMRQKAGVFVSIKKNGLLRGCIGTIFPTSSNIGEEIRENAILAGTKDPRFYPVTEEELPFLQYSVDVLSEPESVSSKEQLNPSQYGVIVRRAHRIGLLLPNLEGINSVEDQLSIACQKAGIEPDSAYDIERFQVNRYE